MSSWINKYAEKGGRIRARNTNARLFREAQVRMQKDIERVTKTLRTLPEDLQNEEMKKILTEGGKIIEKEAKRRVPKDTRSLEQSIRVFGWRKRSQSLVVGPRFPRKDRALGTKPDYYGGFIEFGTMRSDAKPYMRPAYDSKRSQVINVIKRGTVNAVNRWITRNRVQ